MARKEPIKKLLEAVFKLIKSSKERKLKAKGERVNGAKPAEERLSEGDNQAKQKRMVRKTARMLAKSIGNAFEKSGLDIETTKIGKHCCFGFSQRFMEGKARGILKNGRQRNFENCSRRSPTLRNSILA